MNGTNLWAVASPEQREALVYQTAALVAEISTGDHPDMEAIVGAMRNGALALVPRGGDKADRDAFIAQVCMTLWGAEGCLDTNSRLVDIGTDTEPALYDFGD